MSARSPLICSAVELWYKKMLKIGSLSELTGIDTKIKVAGFQRLYSKWLWLLMAVYKPSFADAKMLVICMSVSWVVLEWYLSHDFIVGNMSLSSCKSAYYVLYKCCFLLFSQVTYQYSYINSLMLNVIQLIESYLSH